MKPLKRYRSKRKFDRTSEPFGTSGKKNHEPVFVIQKHDASNLHYDFRIEVDGILKSWAIPKGPSTDPRQKRLALPTEDHPLEYANFEGVIPEEEYGGGKVIVWDAGTFRNLKEDETEGAKSVSESIKDGHITIWLDGKKLKGGYALIRTNQGKSERWLFIKMDDKEADARRNPVSTEPKSVISGKTIEEIADNGEEPEKDS